MLTLDVSVSLRARRRAMNLTLKDVAEASGLSVSYISSIERGKSSPTLDNLVKICDALHVTVSDLMTTPSDDKLLVKKGERVIVLQERGNQYENIYDRGRRMSCSLMRVSGDKEYVAKSRYFDILGYMLEGSLRYTVGDRTFDFEEGDVLYVPAGETQRYQRLGDKESVSVWVMCDAGEGSALPAGSTFSGTRPVPTSTPDDDD